MKNKTLWIAGAILLSIFLVYSCQKETSVTLDQPHAVSIYLTDHETPVFDSVFIEIVSLEVKLEDDSLSNGGWVSLNIRPGIYNILRFRNGIDTLFGTGILPNARLKKLRLTLGTQNSAIQNGQLFPLRVDDDDRQVVVDLFPINFQVNGGQVLFWIDFDAGRSIQVDNSGSGNNNGYRLKSHLKIFTHSNTGRIQGRILPREAGPIVQAVIGSDTATAIPDRDDGEYKIVGLREGTYTLIIDGRNNYRDTILSNIVVRQGEDTHVPLVTLRQ